MQIIIVIIIPLWRISPLSGLGLLFFTFRDMWCVTESGDGPSPNPYMEDHVSVFMTSGARVAQLYP
jgi:hypothetical protein